MTDNSTISASIGPLTKEVRDRLSPDDVIALMLEGNARFRTGTYAPRDMLTEQRATVDG